LKEAAGIVMEKVPICRVTFSVRGLIALLLVPRVKDSFRSKPAGSPALISSSAKAEAKGTPGVTATELISIISPPVKGEPGTLARLSVEG